MKISGIIYSGEHELRNFYKRKVISLKTGRLGDLWFGDCIIDFSLPQFGFKKWKQNDFLD